MIAVTLINALIITTVVIVHYECLLRLNQLMPRLNLWHRFRMVFGVLGALVAHAIQVWIFALGYYLMNRSDSLGRLTGNFDGSFMDSVYFSFTTFTTIGFGDITPTGPLKYLTGLEALTAWCSSPGRRHSCLSRCRSTGAHTPTVRRAQTDGHQAKGFN